MKEIKALEVPNKFYKEKSFVVAKKDLRTFLTAMKGFIEDDNQVTLAVGNPNSSDDISIEQTVESHSGDCRIWSKNGSYIVPCFKTLLMECDSTGSGHLNDIYDWMGRYTLDLHQQHIDYDQNLQNKITNAPVLRGNEVHFLGNQKIMVIFKRGDTIPEFVRYAGTTYKKSYIDNFLKDNEDYKVIYYKTNETI